MTFTLTFHGAAGTVTGSAFRLETPHGEILIDCGMFQGTKTVKELNYRPFPFNAARIKAVLLTHAHIDHSGLLPKLVKDGFRGRIHTTEGTADLLAFMLPDSAHIQEVEVERLNHRNRQRGRGAIQPMYSGEDAQHTLTRLKPHDFDAWDEVIPGVRARFWRAGHILGSASIEVEVRNGDQSSRILFSGDLGPGDKAFHQGAEGPELPDWIVMETTYGNRDRIDYDEDERRATLCRAVRDGLSGGGTLLIPAFAVERTQELLYDLHRLMQEKLLPHTPIFLDSPLARNVTEVFRRHLHDLKKLKGGEDPFSSPDLHIVETVEGSKRLNQLTGGAIIVSASGMCDAGRIRNHLKNHLWRPDSTVLLVGYQAPGTLGAMLKNGVQRVRIHGEEIQVRAAIQSIDVYSGHADQSNLLDWLDARKGVKRGLYLVHGEDEARAAMRDLLVERGWAPESIALPDLDETVSLEGNRPATTKREKLRLAPARVTAKSDWHNRYASTMLSLNQALQTAPDDETRERILQAVQAVTGAATTEPKRQS